MKVKFCASLALVGVLGVGQTALAQGNRQGQSNAPNSAAPNRSGPPGKRRAGDWLRRYQNLPPQDQEKLLSNDPQFQRLPADRQSNLRDHLRNFNSLPPEKKQQVLDRMQKFENLPPAEREQLKALHEKMHQIPESHREMVKTAARSMRDLSPQERDRLLNSDLYRMFSDDERTLIKGLAEVQGQANNAPSTPPNQQR